MDLDALHSKLSKDATYIRAHAELGEYVELALHCRAVREERGITQAELATESGVTAYAVSRFEQLCGAEDWVISAIVGRIEPWLRQRGVHTEQWTRISQERPRDESQPSHPNITNTVRGLSMRPASTPTPDREKLPNPGKT